MLGLVERDEQLATLRELFARAVAGAGHLVFIGAEAGAGKSSLVQAFCDSVAAAARILTGWCEPLSTPRPAGPLHDMAAGLGATVTAILASHERADLFDATLAALRASDRPSVVVFEDVHWADETTLDLLRFLGRRVASAPVLVIATYRDDETGARHPLRARLGDLATQPGVSRMSVPALSLTAVTTLAAQSPIEPRQLWRRTGGNAFYVGELLRAASDDVPASVADAVIARSARLSPPARHALTVAAIAGSRAAPSVLFEVPGVDAAAIDECAEAGLLRFAPPVFAFRHELVRQAVLDALGSAERVPVTAAVLAALRASALGDDDLARLAELAEGAQDGPAVVEFAPAAARQAARLGAHREAAAQYDRALRFVAAEPARADLLEPLSIEQYLTGDLIAAIASREQAVDIRRRSGEALRVGDGLRWLSRLHWYAGHGDQASQAEAESLAALLPLGSTPELAMAMSARSQYLMVSGDSEQAIEWGRRAIDLATELDRPDVIAHASNNVGSAEIALGDPAGIERLRSSLALALEINAEDHVARAYVNLAFHLVASRELDSAATVLDAALAYCTDRDLDIQIPYLRGSRALMNAYAGRWAEAEVEARSLLARPTDSPIHRFVALLPLTIVAVRTGASGLEGAKNLDQLGRLARQPGEVQRLVPYACLRAEVAWLAGTDVSADPELLEVWTAAQGLGSRTEAADLAQWLRRAGLAVDAPRPAAGPLRPVATDPGTPVRPADRTRLPL